MQDGQGRVAGPGWGSTRRRRWWSDAGRSGTGGGARVGQYPAAAVVERCRTVRDGWRGQGGAVPGGGGGGAMQDGQGRVAGPGWGSTRRRRWWSDAGRSGTGGGARVGQYPAAAVVERCRTVRDGWRGQGGAVPGGGGGGAMQDGQGRVAGPGWGSTRRRRCDKLTRPGGGRIVRRRRCDKLTRPGGGRIVRRRRCDKLTRPGGGRIVRRRRCDKLTRPGGGGGGGAGTLDAELSAGGTFGPAASSPPNPALTY